jgi:hypothetical protein
MSRGRGPITICSKFLLMVYFCLAQVRCPCGAGVPAPIPQPLTPGGGKGGFNSRFGFVDLAPRLRFGAFFGFAQTVSGGGAHPMRALRGWDAAGCENLSITLGDAAETAAAKLARFATGNCHLPTMNRCLRKQASAGVGFGSHRHSGRAEQRSGGRIRAGACLSVASLRTTPPHASSARDPAGALPVARLSFAYFSLAKQRKVSRPPGRTPACHATQPTQ